MDKRKECINLMYEIYPLCRKLVFDTFDKPKIDLTRTQQIIILALAISQRLSMSQLAEKINTSNEQATRAVSQLVQKGFIERSQDKSNRRVINISLTEKANAFLNEAKMSIQGELINRFNAVSDEDMQDFYLALMQINKILKTI